MPTAISSYEFEDWMRQVDALLFEEVGITTEDLADQPYIGYYETQISPEDMVKIIINQHNLR